MNTRLQKNTPPTALVTGAAKRIGQAIAKHLHHHGYHVVIHYHQSEKEAQTLANDLNEQKPNSALALKANLCKIGEIKVLMQNTLAWTNGIDLLINNASIFKTTVFESFDESAWHQLFDTNTKAPFILSQLAYPSLKKSKGCIVNITDIHADNPLKGYAAYCQTKAALTMQTKALAKEFAPHVRVNAVAPGAIAWPEEENELSTLQKEKIIEKTPLKRHGKPVFIAQAVLALIDHPFITGEVIRVDGGRHI